MSNDTKHGPGPWRLAGYRTDSHNGGEYKPVLDSTNGWVADVRCNTNAEAANARLIAAAPEMYEALKAMFAERPAGVSAHEWQITRNDAIIKGRQAIAKAEGH